MRLGKRLIALGLAVLMTGSMVACGGGNGDAKGKVKINFMYGGSAADIEMYNLLIDEFNNTVGAEKGIVVKGIPKSNNMDAVLAQQLPTQSGPDVVSVSDRFFKKYTKYFVDLKGKVDQEVLDDFYSDMKTRYHYDYEKTTSNTDDPLYGVPAYSDTTVLYYNKDAMKENGIICISVEEKDLDAFNAGGKDANGKTKADYGLSDVTIPAKGFYRSIAPYVPGEDETDGSSWTNLISGEIAVFNDKIAMNWDEIEDLGMICTVSKNPNSATQYGYYTEWWFNYGWSVGGDCLEDMTGDGDWTYAHATEFPNYRVNEGKTYTGIYSGIKYNAGEFIELRDIIAANPGEEISYSTENGTTFYYTVNGKRTGARDFSSELANGTFTEFPSIKEAFSRFVYLAGVGGLNVCPYPNEFSSTNSVNYFTSEKLAMLVERVSYMSSVEKIMKDEWGVAPLPQYKIYTSPEDPNCDDIVKKGDISACSDGYGLAISSKSDVQEEALEFLKWYATEGQKTLADNGFVSCRTSDAELMLGKLAYPNASVVLDSLQHAKAGDWWYMPDREWIANWSQPLNLRVRYGTETLEEYLYSYIDVTNKALEVY